MFYLKLAIRNIKKNRQIYFPYLFTSFFTIAMFYIVSSLKYNEGLQEHKTLILFMQLGIIVMSIFSFIFMLYANSFVMKRRMKEISLYNILGMEKRHLMIMMFFETVIICIVSLFIGMIVGILFSQLMYLILLNIMHMKAEFIFSIPIKSMIETTLSFIIIFFISLLYNLKSISFTQSIELLKASSSGEREPKTKMIITIIGLISLISGYIIAIKIEEPVEAIMMFFVAVILVIIGTYCLFTAGSIALLKALKKNKSYYYQTKHFTSVSTMIYRMKQNAVGLANICILCTCVLVTLSSTLCLYQGIVSMTDTICTSDQIIATTDQTGEQLQTILKQEMIKQKLNYTDYYTLNCYETVGYFIDNHITLEQTEDYKNLVTINLVSLDEYNKAFHQNQTLKDNEVLVYSSKDINNEFFLEDTLLHIKDTINDTRIMVNNNYAYTRIAIVFKDDNVIKSYIKDKTYSYYYSSAFNSTDDKLKQVVNETLSQYGKLKFDNGYSYFAQNKQEYLENGYELYGSLLFIGILLSTMFLLAAILIMYNKQISEGYEDQKRFEILQNVGMTHKEVKQSIRSQILIVFFLPLIVSIIHLSFAYSLIKNVLNGLLITNNNYYLYGCIIVVCGLMIIYSIVYILTAKVYYRIVKK
jgi:putative ABC transport system permease protein